MSQRGPAGPLSSTAVERPKGISIWSGSAFRFGFGARRRDGRGLGRARAGAAWSGRGAERLRDERMRKLSIYAKGDSVLCVDFDVADLHAEGWSGQMECSFKTPVAREILSVVAPGS